MTFSGFNSKTKPHHLPHDRTKQCKPVLLHMINYIPMFYIDAIIYQFSKLDAMLANLCWIKWTQGDYALKKKTTFVKSMFQLDLMEMAVATPNYKFRIAEGLFGVLTCFVSARHTNITNLPNGLGGRRPRPPTRRVWRETKRHVSPDINQNNGWNDLELPVVLWYRFHRHFLNYGYLSEYIMYARNIFSGK